MNNLEVKEFRKKNNLTQEDLAKITGVQLRTVKAWEYGERNVSKLAEKLINNYTHSVESNHKTLNTNAKDDLTNIKNLPHDKQMEVLNKKLDYIMKSEDLNRIYIKTLLAFHDIKIDMFESKEKELEQLKKTVN